mgnify:CR=1 FL=1
MQLALLVPHSLCLVIDILDIKSFHQLSVHHKLELICQPALDSSVESRFFKIGKHVPHVARVKCFYGFGERLL